MTGTGSVHGRDAGLLAHRTDGTPTCADCRRYSAAQRAQTRKRAYLRAGRSPYVDPTGTRRRIRALAAMGWSYRALGQQCDRGASAVHAWLVSDLVETRTAAVVAKLYDRLAMTPGPSPQARAKATAKGWPPPLAWDDVAIDDPAAVPSGTGRPTRAPVDEVAVQRALHGDRVALTAAGRAEAIQQLTARGRSAAEIAELLGTTSRSVQRHRAATSRRTA